VNGTRIRRSGAFVALLLTALIVAGAQSSAARGGPGTIAFTKPLLGVAGGDLVMKSSDICVVRSDGTGLTRLAHGSGHSSIRGGVTWSPDGSRLAFIRGQVFDRASVWVMNADGSGQQLVTRSKKYLASRLAWSPGEEIVFSNVEGDDVVDLLAVKADGSGLRHVTPAGKRPTMDTQPARAPDGRIFFARMRSDKVPSKIYSVAADGSGLTPITRAEQPASFSLSPDGKWLLLWDRTRDALVRVPVSGQGEDLVLVEKVSRYVPRRLPVASSWSPDGSQIAFAADGWWPSALYIVNADGSGLGKVPNAGKAWNPVWLPQ
jgi:Tol biopolymer transport system component